MSEPDYRAQRHFAHELECLIERTCMEYDLTYATIIGLLEGAKFDLILESLKQGDDTEDE